MTNLLIFTSLSFVKSKGVFYMLNYLRKRIEKWKIYNWNIFETIKTPFTNFGCIWKDGFYLLILLAFCMFEVKYFNFFKSLSYIRHVTYWMTFINVIFTDWNIFGFNSFYMIQIDSFNNILFREVVEDKWRIRISY